MVDRSNKKKTRPKIKRGETPLSRRKGRSPSKRHSTEKSAYQQNNWEPFFISWLYADFLSFCLGDSPYFCTLFSGPFALTLKFRPELEGTMFAKVWNNFLNFLVYKVMKKDIRGAGFPWFG